jgi:hypothetical protein
MDMQTRRPLGWFAGAPFQRGGEAMEKIHEGGFETNCNRYLGLCMCGAAVVQLV